MRALLALSLLAACATDELALTANDGFDDTDPSIDGKSDTARTTVHRFADRRLFPEGVRSIPAMARPTRGASSTGRSRASTRP